MKDIFVIGNIVNILVVFFFFFWGGGGGNDIVPTPIESLMVTLSIRL
jgi:hypothetical protein